MDVALSASIVSPILDAEANGPHSVIIDLAHGLAARGHRATVYAAAGSRLDGIDLVEINVSRDASAGQVRPGQGAPTIDLSGDFGRMYEAIRRGGHDVLSQHAFDAPALRLDPRLPVLHTLHLPPLVPAVVAAARETSAPLAAVSAASFVDWEAAGVRPDWLLPNGVPDRGFRSERPEHVALVAGRISPEKGTDVAVRAAASAGLRPWVVGDPYDRTYFEAQVRPLLADAEYFGAVPRHKLSALMARAAVLVMPVGWPEPFGLVAAEAQMAGCPVVAYRRGALADVVEHGVSGLLVEPDDEAALPAAIRRAMALDRCAVRQSATQRLGVDQMIGAYERALTEVANGMGAVPSPASPRDAAVG